MKFLRRIAGHRRNEDVLEIKADIVYKKLARYKQKYVNYVNRMKDIWYPKH
jgi:hypothetical protein